MHSSTASSGAATSAVDPALRMIAPDRLVLIGDVGREGSGADRGLRSLKARGSHVAVVDSRAHRSIDAPAILSATDGVPVDLALICGLSADDAVVAAEACVEAGVSGVAIVGVTNSPELRDRLARLAASAPIRILGPNAFGPFNAKGNLFLRPYAGSSDSGLAVFTQSGNFLSDVVGTLQALADTAPRIGWALGNMLDVNLAEAVRVAGSDESVRAIAVHCEGMSGGRQLIRAIRSAAERKPIVVLLAGTSELGKRVTISHTASLGVSEVVATGAARQAGATVAVRADEFAILADSLGRTRAASGNRVAIMADGGGHATLAVDRLVHAGLELAPLTDRTVARISALIGHEIDPHAPLDVDDLKRPTLGFEVASIAAADPEVDLVFLVGALSAYATHFAEDALGAADVEGARMLVAAAASFRKPVVGALFHASPNSQAHRVLREGGVVVLQSIDHAVTVARELVERGRFLAHVDARSAIPEPRPRLDRVRCRRPLLEPEARARLRDAGIDAGGFAVATTASQCADAVRSFGRPCALKILSPAIVHKADVGGILLDVKAGAAESAFDALVERVAGSVSEFELNGVMVAPMASRGVELLVGAYRDPDLGPCVTVGSGGHLVELVRDIVFRTAPVTRFEAEEMLAGTRAARLLEGYRGSDAVDIGPISELIVAVSQLIFDVPEVEEIDLNPVIVGPSGPQLVDVRVVVDD
jgi:acetyltransferase